MKKFSRFFLGGILVTIGCGFFLYPNFREWNTQREVDKIIEVFDQTYSETIEQNEDSPNQDSPNQGSSNQDSKDLQNQDLENQGSKNRDSKNQDSQNQNSAGDSATVSEDVNVGDKKDASSKTPKNVSDENDELESSVEDDSLTESDATIENSINVPTARPYQSLYDEMVKYNEDLSTNGQHIVDAWSYEQQPLDISLMDDDSPVIGYIEIPDMQIRLPLMLGASTDNLEKGAAVLSETSLPIGGTDTNCVIAGHRGWEGSAYFQYVENMKRGSKVYVTNPWETLVYECTDIKVIYPDDVSSILIQPGKDMITLFTCHPYRLGGGPYRYLVFCERVDTQKRVSTKGQHVINPKVDENEPVSETSWEDIEDMKLEDINKAIDKKEETAKETKKEDSESTSQHETTAEVIIRDESGESHEDIPPAELISDDGNLIALEQTLRFFLPIAVIAASIIIVLLRSVKPKKKKKKKSQRRTKI